MGDPPTHVSTELQDDWDDPVPFNYDVKQWGRIKDSLKLVGIAADEFRFQDRPFSLRWLLEVHAYIYLQDLQLSNRTSRQEARELQTLRTDVQRLLRHLEFTNREGVHGILPREFSDLIATLTSWETKLQRLMKGLQRAPKASAKNAGKPKRDRYLGELQIIWQNLPVIELAQRKQMVDFMLACAQPVEPTLAIHTINNFLDHAGMRTASRTHPGHPYHQQFPRPQS